MTIWFSAEAFERQRVELGVTWGRPLRLLEQTDSTNDLALDAVAGEAKTGIVWLAHQQLRGRGRRGGTWLARPGESLATSVLVRVPTPHELGAGFSLLAGLAVRALVARRLPSATVTVKWPNDVMVDGRKCAGILVESRLGEAGRSLGIVIGVGINLSVRDFPPELPDATSLALAGAEPSSLAPERLLAELLAELETRTRRYLPHGLSRLLPELEQHDYLRGRTLRIAGIEGTAAGFDERGNLGVRTADGELVWVQSGHVELTPVRTAAGT
ncbi:MAG TPA: biotin--[acetyl-CoA-carboxylase] ligase [Polyangiaceae bacterium]|nr:biotin--[acetyl-CoA-carboxylase] ligase [Polyangiaceae bacterium]